MTNKEINECLAENLFGLRRGKDFDYWDNRFAEAGLGGNMPVKDYVKDYHLVLEKLLAVKDGKNYHKEIKVTISYDSQKQKHNCKIEHTEFGSNEFRNYPFCLRKIPIETKSDVLGEAICQCVVEYLIANSPQIIDEMARERKSE